MNDINKIGIKLNNYIKSIGNKNYNQLNEDMPEYL